MEKGGFQNHPLMRLTLALTLGLLLLFWVTNFGLYFSRMSLRPSSSVNVCVSLTRRTDSRTGTGALTVIL